MHILSDPLMPYLAQYRQMLSLRNLTKVSRKSYPTYKLPIFHTLTMFFTNFLKMFRGKS